MNVLVTVCACVQIRKSISVPGCPVFRGRKLKTEMDVAKKKPPVRLPVAKGEKC